MSQVELVQRMIDKELAEVRIVQICRIVSFDPASMRADVQPVYKDDSGVQFATIRNVPVSFIYDGSFYIRPDYQSGTLVVVGFSERSIDNAARDYSAKRGKEFFNAKGAIVIGAIAKTGWTPPAEFSVDSGLLIGHKDGGSYLQMQSDKISMKFGTTEVRFDQLGGMEIFINGIKLFGSLTHVHPPDSTPPTPGT